MAAEPAPPPPPDDDPPRPRGVPALFQGDGWDIVRKEAPGETGRRLARQIMDHATEMRAGELVVMFKFSKLGRLYAVRLMPAAIECQAEKTTG